MGCSAMIRNTLKLGKIEAHNILSGVGIQKFFVPLQLISFAAFAQVQINLHLPTPRAVHSLFMRLPSRPPRHQSCSL
jgi:hypothetical protein